jgi:hypothetical protein
MSSDLWSTAPLGLLHLDADGYVLQANDTFVDWAAGQDDGAHVRARDVTGRRIGDLLTVGGRIYWDTHVVATLTLAGRVDAVRVEVRTPDGPLPALLTAALAPGGGIDVAVLAVRRRAEFDQEMARARAAAERSADRLHWVQQATAALSHAAGRDQVRAALLSAVRGNPRQSRAAPCAPAHRDAWWSRSPGWPAPTATSQWSSTTVPPTCRSMSTPWPPSPSRVA